MNNLKTAIQLQLVVLDIIVKVTVKTLIKYKRQFTKLFIVLVAFNLVHNYASFQAYAPKMAHAQYEKVAKPLTEREEIINFIISVFGKDSDNAIKVAQCESHLNPKAVGHNTDDIQSTDFGLFQINDKWQGVTNTSFLLDYKINTMMAKKIFDSRGNWNAWTCVTKWGALK